MDIITDIEEVVGSKGFEDYQGYVITTTQQVIRVLISRFRGCCEEFDVDIILPGELTDIASNALTDINSLIGQHVTNVKWAYTKHNSTTVYDRFEACVEVHTSIGLVKLIAWNEHNGYYSHTVKITWKNHEDEQEI